MEYKEAPAAEKGCPYPLNRVAATHRIFNCILFTCLATLCTSVTITGLSLRCFFFFFFFYFVIVFFRDNSLDEKTSSAYRFGVTDSDGSLRGADAFFGCCFTRWENSYFLSGWNKSRKMRLLPTRYSDGSRHAIMFPICSTAQAQEVNCCPLQPGCMWEISLIYGVSLGDHIGSFLTFCDSHSMQLVSFTEVSNNIDIKAL